MVTRNLPLDPRRIALRFALGGLIGIGGFFLTVGPLGLLGPLAVGVPIVAFFIAGATAGAGLRMGVVVTIGFGLVFVVSGIGSFMAAVARQAMTGQESATELTLFCVGYFAISWGLGGLIALGFLWRAAGRLWVLGGFVGGGIVGGLILGMAMIVDVFEPPVIALALVVPPTIGGAVVARAMNIARTLEILEASDSNAGSHQEQSTQP